MISAKRRLEEGEEEVEPAAEKERHHDQLGAGQELGRQHLAAERVPELPDLPVEQCGERRLAAHRPDDLEIVEGVVEEDDQLAGAEGLLPARLAGGANEPVQAEGQDRAEPDREQGEPPGDDRGDDRHHQGLGGERHELGAHQIGPGRPGGIVADHRRDPAHPLVGEIAPAHLEEIGDHLPSEIGRDPGCRVADEAHDGHAEERPYRHGDDHDDDQRADRDRQTDEVHELPQQRLGGRGGLGRSRGHRDHRDQGGKADALEDTGEQEADHDRERAARAGREEDRENVAHLAPSSGSTQPSGSTRRQRPSRPETAGQACIER
jgi:hypothetical protein